MTLLIAGYILWQSFSEIGPAIRILMLGSPPETDVAEVIAALGGSTGSQEVHHAHLWQMQEHDASLEAHLVVADAAWGRAEAVKAAAREVLSGFGIGHSTLELERASDACRGAPAVGHRVAAASLTAARASAK